MSDFLKLCRERGYLHQCTDETGLADLMNQGPISAYIGFDCTAPSLHVGSLIQIMLLRQLQKCGHKPIVLMGGGTTKVGDPSGKDASRQMLSDEQILANMAGIKKVFSKFLHFGEGPTDAVMVNNDDWLKNLNYIDFLRDYGRFFSINQMLTMESVKQRLVRESELSFLEFNYMVLQAYDFYHLALPKSLSGYNCRLQIGGSDQYGNILMGIRLAHSKIAAFMHEMYDVDSYINEKLESISKKTKRSKYEITPENLEFIKNEVQTNNILNQNFGARVLSECHEGLFGLTSPLITTASGAKMGKTAEGAVWLNYDEGNPDFSKSPYDYWQFWRNCDDADVERFLKLFTDLPLGEIAALMAGNINDAKKRLANEATALLHGESAAEEAAATAKAVFEGGGVGAALPEAEVNSAELQAGIPAFKLLLLAGLAESGGEARRLIKGGGAKVNDQPIARDEQLIGMSDVSADGYIKLSAGKKRHVLVKPAA